MYYTTNQKRSGDKLHDDLVDFTRTWLEDDNNLRGLREVKDGQGNVRLEKINTILVKIDRQMLIDNVFSVERQSKDDIEKQLIEALTETHELLLHVIDQTVYPTEENPAKFMNNNEIYLLFSVLHFVRDLSLYFLDDEYEGIWRRIIMGIVEEIEHFLRLTDFQSHMGFAFYKSPSLVDEYRMLTNLLMNNEVMQAVYLQELSFVTGEIAMEYVRERQEISSEYDDYYEDEERYWENFEEDGE